MKSILLVTQGFPLGNSERGFLEVEHAVLRQKSDLHILAVTDLENTESDASVHTFQHKKPSVVKMLLQLLRREVLMDIASARADCNVVRYLKRIRRILSYSARAMDIQRVMEVIVREKQIDIIYTYWCLPATVAAVRLKKKYNITVVTRFHRFDLYRDGEKYGWQPLRKFISRGVEKLIFVCGAGREYYNNEFGDYREKSVVSYLGTKACLRTARKETGCLKVVSCSNVIPLKRVEMIADCIRLASRRIRIEWHHIGGPEKTFEFMDGEKVTYVAHGAVPHDQVIELFQEICPDVFITLSTTEGLAVSVQESLSMGIPVITTDVGGSAELVVTNHNGYLLPVDISEQVVADLLVSFHQLPESERQRYSEEALTMWKKKCDAAANAEAFVAKLITL